MTGTGLTSLDNLDPSSYVLAIEANIPDSLPAISLDNRYVVANQVGFNMDLYRIEITTNQGVVLSGGEVDLPVRGHKKSTLGGINPIVAGDSVIYTHGMSLFQPGSGRQEFMMAVPVAGGNPAYLFYLDGSKAKVIDARVDREAEFLLVGDINNKKGWFVLRGQQPEISQAEFVVAHAHETIQFGRVAVSGDWNVFASNDPMEQNKWIIFNRQGRELARTPQDAHWQRLQLGPKGRFFAVMRPNPRRRLPVHPSETDFLSLTPNTILSTLPS